LHSCYLNIFVKVCSPECIGKRHDSITDKLKLGLELGVLLGQPLVPRAHRLVALVVGGAQAAGVAALEVILPEFWKENSQMALRKTI